LILGKDHVSLLLTAGSNHSVYLADLDTIESNASLLDHGLSGALVNNEGESVVVFNGLDGALGAFGVLDNGILVPSDLLLDTV